MSTAGQPLLRIDFVLYLLTAMGCGFSLVLAIAQLVVQRRYLVKYVLAAILFCVFVILLYGAFVQSKPHLILPGAFYLHIPATFFIGPLFLTYAYAMTREGFKPSRRFKLHFVHPVAISIASIAIFLLSDKTTLGDLISYYYGASISVFDLILITGWGVNMLYFMLIIKESIFLFQPRNLSFPIGRMVVLFLAGCTAMTAMAGVSVLLKSFFVMNLTTSLISFLVAFAFLVSQRFPEFISEIQAIATERSELANVDVERVLKELNVFMAEKQLYLDENLTINLLAHRVGITRNQLSELLNDRLQKNYSTYVNEFRVEEAKKVLKEEAWSILEVAFAAGFNSKSTFNATFHRITGQTPSDYRAS